MDGLGCLWISRRINPPPSPSSNCYSVWRAAEPPSRRAAEPPSRRAAEPLNNIPYSFYKHSTPLASRRAAEPLNNMPYSFCKHSTRLASRRAGVLVDLDPLKIGPPGPNPLANMDPRGCTFASGFVSPSRIWTPSKNLRYQITSTENLAIC